MAEVTRVRINVERRAFDDMSGEGAFWRERAAH